MYLEIDPLDLMLADWFIIFDIKAYITIPRENCFLIDFLCVQVLPGDSNEWEDDPNHVYSQCLQASSYLNCDG